MKTILIGATMLLSSVFSFGQKLTTSDPIEVKGNAVSNSKLKFYDDRYFVECVVVRNTINYFIYDRENNTFGELKCRSIIPGYLSAAVIQYYILDDHIYELSFGTKAGKTKYVVTKRSLTDEDKQEQVWTYERGIERWDDGRVALFLDNDGAILVSSSNDVSECFMERLDKNMQSLWKKEVPGLAMPQSVFKFRKLDSGTLLVEVTSSPISGQEYAKGGVTVSKTQMRLVAVESNDEVNCIAPQINRPMAISNAIYSYDDQKNEFIGLLFTHEVSTSGRMELSGQGYSYFIWDDQGSIQHSYDKNLTYGDLITSEDRKTLAGYGNNITNADSDPLPAFEHPLIAAYYTEEGDFVIHMQRLEVISGDQREPFGAGNFLLRIKNDGTMGWCKFIPNASDVTYLNMCQLVVDQDKIHLAYIDFKGNAGNPSGIVGVRQSKKELNDLGILHFDYKTGEFTGADALHLKLPENEYYLDFLFSNFIYYQLPDNVNTGKCFYLKGTEMKSEKTIFYNICFE